MQYYVLILLIEYFILRLYVGMTGPGFYPVRGGERDRERQITTVENYQNLYFMAAQVFSVLCAASACLHFWYLKHINRTITVSLPQLIIYNISEKSREDKYL